MILWRYVLHEPVNRRYLWAAFVISLILWGPFKWLYPYPNLVLDSYYYVKAAVLNWDVNAWPIGYSRFLQLFNLFSHSANLLVSLQYFFLEAACLIFFFTWRYLFKPGRLVTNLVFTVLFINPLFLYISNYILSDTLFAGLSILWITQVLWIIYRPRPYMIATHALLLFLAFTVRYNALYYPFIGALAFIFCRRRIWFKIAGIATPAVLLLLFVLYTSIRIGKITGQKQFSAFAGWKTANDALYMYAHVYQDNPAPVPERFRVLDSMARQYFRVYKDSGDLLKPEYTSGSFLMFAQESPLVQYMFHLSGVSNKWPFINTKEWIAVGPLYQAYGTYLIRRYPQAFARWFVWPNLQRYINPPGEIFGSGISYMWLGDYGGEYVATSLHLYNVIFRSGAIRLSQTIFSPYPKIFAMIHAGFFIGLIGFLFCGGFRRLERSVSRCLIVVACLWSCDLIFSIISAGIVIRYQLFLTICEAAFGSYFIRYVYVYLDRSHLQKAITLQNE